MGGGRRRRARLPTVAKWRRRFPEHGVEGSTNRRRGRPASRSAGPVRARVPAATPAARRDHALFLQVDLWLWLSQRRTGERGIDISFLPKREASIE